MPVVHNVLFSAQEEFEPLPLSLALHAVVRWCVIMSVKIKESFTVYYCLTHFSSCYYYYYYYCGKV